MNGTQFEQQIVTAHSDRMYKLALRLMEDPQSSYDIVQNCFLTLWEKRKKLNHIQNLGAYCSRMVYNAAMDMLKANSKFIEFQPENNHDSSADLEDVEDIEAIFQERYELLNTMVSKWKSEDKALLHLRIYEEKSYDELAEILGGNSGRWRTRFSRLMKELKTEVKQYHESIS